MTYQSKTLLSTSTVNLNDNQHGTANSVEDEDFTRYITPARARCILATKGLSEEAVDALAEMIEYISADKGGVEKN